MKSIAILAVGLVTAPFAAFAGGPVGPATEPTVAAPVVIVPTYADGDWGGFYAGAQLGYVNVTSDGAGLSGNDAIGGLHAGYRYDMGRTVVGGELDYNFANIDLDSNNNNNDSTLDAVARLKLMVGADLGRVLVYATAGGAYADASIGGFSASSNGYFAGVGMDYKLNDNVNVGAELLGHRFEDFDDSGVDIEAVALQAKVAYRF